jgi:ATP-dependent RNA helicase DDX51/DBP6
LQCLCDRVVPRLRALVLVPTRDLVKQVTTVFRAYTSGTGLHVYSCTGQRKLAVEQAVLGVTEGDGAVDVLVCTPGRLVDHLDQTPGFTLQNLRCVVPPVPRHCSTART